MEQYMPENFTPTEVTEDDLKMPVHIITGEPDDMHDSAWEPDEDIIIILTEMGELNDAEFSSLNEEFSDNSEALFADKVTEDIKDLTPEEIQVLKQEAKAREDVGAKDGEAPPERDADGRIKYTAETQPRDVTGKFRTVLARIKQDLGTSGLQNVLDKVTEAENFDSAGDYAGAAKAATDLLGIIDRLDTGALNADSLENVRNSAGELGKVISNLPFAFGQEAQKIRFSDVPPALRDLMTDMIKKVEAKIGKEDADVATAELKTFISGSELYNQSEISSQMSKLLRLLT